MTTMYKITHSSGARIWSDNPARAVRFIGWFQHLPEAWAALDTLEHAHKVGADMEACVEAVQLGLTITAADAGTVVAELLEGRINDPVVFVHDGQILTLRVRAGNLIEWRIFQTPHAHDVVAPRAAADVVEAWFAGVDLGRPRGGKGITMSGLQLELSRRWLGVTADELDPLIGWSSSNQAVAGRSNKPIIPGVAADVDLLLALTHMAIDVEVQETEAGVGMLIVQRIPEEARQHLPGLAPWWPLSWHRAVAGHVYAETGVPAEWQRQF